MVIDRRMDSRVQKYINSASLLLVAIDLFGQYKIETEENSVPFFGVGNNCGLDKLFVKV